MPIKPFGGRLIKLREVDAGLLVGALVKEPDVDAGVIEERIGADAVRGEVRHSVKTLLNELIV